MNKFNELQSEAFLLCEKRESGFVLTDEWFKIFGELIVKECINQARLEEDRFYSIVEDDLALTMEHFQLVLKQHFGVE